METKMKYPPSDPTARFIPYHGNYGGWGSRGGEPIDELDEVCFRHDCEYDLSYIKIGVHGRTARAKADRKFIVRARAIAYDNRNSMKLCFKSILAALYFQA